MLNRLCSLVREQHLRCPLTLPLCVAFNAEQLHKRRAVLVQKEKKVRKKYSLQTEIILTKCK